MKLFDYKEGTRLGPHSGMKSQRNRGKSLNCDNSPVGWRGWIMRNERVWVVVSPSGHTKSGAFPLRKEAIREAIPGCMGSPEYYDLATDEARWKYLQRRGYRAVRATLTLEAAP